MYTSEQSGHRDFVWTIEINRYFLELFSLWPDKRDKNNFISCDLRVIITSVTLITLCIIPLVSALVQVWDDMICLIDNLQVTLSVSMVLIKLIVVRWKRSAFSTLLRMMAEDWMEVNVDAERDVMIKRVRTARLIMICEYCLIISIFSVIVTFPYFGLSIRPRTNLTDRNRLLPLQTYYFYDTDKSPQYELTYLTHIISLFLCGIIYTSVDAFLGIVIFHTCGQLENFRRRLVNLLVLKEFNSTLSNCVLIHLRVMKFVRNIEDIFSLLMLGLFIYFCIVFCFFGFGFLTIFNKDVNDVSFSRKSYTILGSVVLLVHTFLYCGAGELLIEQCEALHGAICDLKWYKLGAKNGKALILLMIRANEPFCITAGKVVPLTMTTFCSLLKTTAGYISVLRTKQG